MLRLSWATTISAFGENRLPALKILHQRQSATVEEWHEHIIRKNWLPFLKNSRNKPVSGLWSWFCGPDVDHNVLIKDVWIPRQKHMHLQTYFSQSHTRESGEQNPAQIESSHHDSHIGQTQQTETDVRIYGTRKLPLKEKDCFQNTTCILAFNQGMIGPNTFLHWQISCLTKMLKIHNFNDYNNEVELL